MRKHVAAASAALFFGPLGVCAYATVPVEQIEAYENYPTDTTYAPVEFGGSTVVTVGMGYGGQYNGLYFHADPNSGLYYTESGHANTVGDLFYGSNTVAYAGGFVTDIYTIEADEFFLNVVGVPVSGGSTGVGTVPGTFAGGAKVINNSYIDAEDSTSAYQNDNRRLDFMINQADAVWVAGAVTNIAGYSGTAYLSWSDFNSLAVSGIQNSSQSFSPASAAGIGKIHADLSIPTEDASFSTATVSGYAAALWGNAQNASQTDAQHGVVVRSLLMAGADKDYTHPASNSSTGALDPVAGAGLPDYDRSLSILQAGEKSLLTVGSGSAVTGTPSTTQHGWASANVSSGTQSVVLFQSANGITGLTASLNWDVTSSQPSSGQINTSAGAVIFPNLTLEVRPVTLVSGQYVLGSALSNTVFQSAVTGDNVQYLWSTAGLTAGSYAFLIGGDSTYSPQVGFSYTLAGSFASQWNSSAGSSWGTATNWTNGIPNGQGAQANLLASPGLTAAGTITLDGDRRVGQLTFNNSNGYTIATGTGGVLTIDDTGDSSGTATPLISVLSGNQTISAAVAMANGVTITTASGSSLTIAGTLNGSGNVTKAGNGTLLFGASSSGILTRTIPLNISAGTVTLAAASSSANRQLLISSGFSIAGSSGSWTGRLDLNNNDLDVPGGSLATLTSQLSQGYNGGNWNASGGIISSSAGTNTQHLTTLGIIQNNQNGMALFTATNLFDGTTPGTTDILVKYTYYGDANLDGKVDGSDYSRIDSGFSTHTTGWFNGDFNYDGVVDGSDYTLIDNAFNSQGTSLAAVISNPFASSTAQIAAVPEPATLSLCCVAILPMLGRRRNRRLKI